MKPSLKREQRLYDALRNVTKYDTPRGLRRSAERHYGLPYEEVLEMAYENVLEEAKAAIKGMKRPTEEPK
jgi:hypothetical protein